MPLFLFIPSFALFLLLFIRLIFPIYKNNKQNNKSQKLLFCITFILFIFACKAVFYFTFGKSFFAPELPRNLLIVMEFCYAFVATLLFITLCRDVLLIIHYFYNKIFDIKHNYKNLFTLIIISFVLSIYGSYEAIKVPQVKTIYLKINDLPNELNNFKIIQLTDLHIRKILDKQWLEKVVEKTNLTNANLILLTGDYVDDYVENLSEEMQLLKSLKAYNKFAVLGNHEYFYNATQWRNFFDTNLQIPMLYNDYKLVEYKGKKIIISGITDYAAARFGLTLPDAENTLLNAQKQHNADFVIMLSHQPKNAQQNAEVIKNKTPFLQLSGHTHGGLTLYLQPIIALFNNGFVNGLYALNKEENKWLYVSAGTGLWGGFSFRLGTTSEITEIILVKN